MRVLTFSLAYLPFVGGAELAIKEITDRLGDIEFDLITANLDGQQKPQEKIGNVTVFRVGSGKSSKYFFPWLAFKKAQELQTATPYNIIWAMMANQAGLAALKFKKKYPAVKYLLTLQEGDSVARIWSRTWFMRGTYKNIYRRADAIQAISNFLARRAKKYGYQKNVAVVPNGVDMQNFSKAFNQQELDNLKTQLGITQADTVVITTSRLVHKNGLDILIKAVKDLPVKLLILGSGPLESKLKSLVQQLKLENKVKFLGYKSHVEMIPYLKISHIFSRPSRSEGLGASFLEAMGAGLPVIAPNVGGISDFLVDHQTGLFCAVDNPADLAKKIKMLCEDENLRQRLAANGKQLMVNSYSWDKIAVEMKNIFQKL